MQTIKSGDGEKNRNWCFANTFYLEVAVSSICKCIVPCPVNVNCTINKLYVKLKIIYS